MRLLAFTTAALLLSHTLSAQTVPTGFVIDTLVPSGLNAPLDFCFLPDGRCLIANRAGVVSVYAGGPAVTVGTVPNVENSGYEGGLMSIAADPSFPTNGQIYVWYSSTLDHFMHLDRFTCTGDLANPVSTNLSFLASTRCVILASVPDTVTSNHHGGSVRFGPDGKLYQTTGDDFQYCVAQNTSSSLGCLLRMDVSGLAPGGSTVAPTFSSLDPGDNPLSSASDISQLVIAYGLRNPVRMEIDMVTGSLYIGDVGQLAVEELSEYVYPTTGPLPLVNFGWPWQEGNQAYMTCSGSQPPGLVPPIAVMPRATGWVSAYGGARYRNQGGPYDFGPAYEGNAFFYDYFTGDLRRLVNTGAWGPAPVVPGQPNATYWGTGFVATGAMRVGPDGGLWFVKSPSAPPSTGGTLNRIRPPVPTNSVTAISGGGQVGPAGEAFAAPLVARVLNPQGQPLPGGTVNFSVVGSATLSTTNPVTADANGYAQTNASATATGGAITVTASTPGSQTNGTFALFARRIIATPAGSYLVLMVSNTTTAVPPNVPYVVMVSFPGGTPLPTVLGNICTNPLYGLTVVLEDGTGIFNFVSFSGTGGIGTPNLTKLYTVPPGLLLGFLMSFQAVGFDPVTGWFRTNCEQRQF